MSRKWHEVLAWSSLAGFTACLTWNLGLRTPLFSGPRISGPNPYLMLLYFCIFLLLLPTALYYRRFNKETSPFGLSLRVWKYVFRGAPRWSLWIIATCAAYALACFLPILQPDLNKPTEEQRTFELLATAQCMLLYAIIAVINWAAVRRTDLGIDWVCQRGHALSPSDKFCSECGAPAKAASAP